MIVMIADEMSYGGVEAGRFGRYHCGKTLDRQSNVHEWQPVETPVEFEGLGHGRIGDDGAQDNQTVNEVLRDQFVKDIALRVELVVESVIQVSAGEAQQVHILCFCHRGDAGQNLR